MTVLGLKQRVEIDGKRFKITGPVRVTNITATPNPIIFGDTSRVGETQVMTQLAVADSLGGSGIFIANSRTEANRHWRSRCETRYRNQLCLPPLAVDMGKPAGETDNCTLTKEFNTEQYFAFGARLYRWIDASASWSALDATLGGVPTEAVLFDGKLFVAYGVGYAYKASGVWTDVPSTPASYWSVWDQKLWRIGLVSNQWTLYSSTTGLAGSWTQKGVLRAGLVVTDLVTYRDAQGATALYAITDRAHYVWDDTNSRFLETEVRYPPVPSPDRPKADVWRDGRLYAAIGGLSVLAINAGNPVVISPVGLDQDDGVPAEDRGRILNILADVNHVYVLINGAVSLSPTDDDFISGWGEPFDSAEWPLGEGPATLRAWNGGWHVIWESTGATTAPSGAMEISSAYSRRRLYFNGDGKALYIDLPQEIYNPRQNLNQKFAPGPKSHYTPWFYYESQVRQKIHGHFHLKCRGLSASETVTVYYGKDLEDAWNLLQVLTADGTYELKVPDNAGVQSPYFRYRFDLTRGSDPAKSPFVEYWTADTMQLLPATYGYGFTVSLDEDIERRTPAQQLKELKDLADPAITPLFYPFTFYDALEGPQTYYGRITRVQGMEYPGDDQRGLGEYFVSFVVPYQEDVV
jgi:hypothetical protein